MTSQETLRQEMLGYDSCLISDALEKVGLAPGIGEIRRLVTGKRIFGRAVTVTLESFGGAVPKRHLGTTAVELAQAGDIIVVQHRSRSDCAGWGGLLSTAAVARGIGGVVVDGLVRDIDESEELGFPVFARAATPVTARNRVIEVATNDPITIAGLVVRPGDYVLADGSGVAVIPQDRFDEVVQAARDMLRLENGIRASLAAGTPIGTAMNESYERAIGPAAERN